MIRSPETKVSVIDRNDAALKARQFFIQDPVNSLKLTMQAPDSLKGATIQYYYDETPRTSEAERRKKVFCVMSGCRHENHFKGYVVRFPDGSLRTIGQHCGAKHFGSQFDEIVRAFADDRDRSRVLLRCDEANRLFPDLLYAVHDLCNAPSERLPLKTKNAINAHSPGLCRALLQSRGRLMAPKRVRNIEAEQARDKVLFKEMGDLAKERFGSSNLDALEPETLDDLTAQVLAHRPDLAKKPIFSMTEAEFARVSGLQALIHAPYSAALKEASATLKAFWYQTQAVGPSVATSQIRKILKGAGEAAAAVQDILDKINSLGDLFSQESLGPIARWATETNIAGGPYGVSAGDAPESYALVGGQNQTFRLALPADWAPLESVELTLFLEVTRPSQARAPQVPKG
ncbi:MAG TPA: hypothetical protein DD390_10405 [Rhodospirillaceae bacterium]|nr:hypothetical protein [Rhodospirillaceae bacterium]MAX61886.1 hypothetical protein [Rhodospirillaceae bacterium]HBM13095.1 hypothetical protein [Rhodospirillaceae bacterium]|tara:strand:+ start:92641 stop:93846 length:1206 start_codon:yes stop_codon:yes gene_type:complete